MNFSADNLLLIALVILPGFVAVRARSAMVVSRPTDDKRTLYSALAASILLFTPLSPVILWMAPRWQWLFEHRPVRMLVLSIMMIAIWPIVAGAGVALLSRTSAWGRVTRRLRLLRAEPRGWDIYFARGKECYVRATLMDGRVIAGVYGGASGASSFPASEDIYLALQCKVNQDTGCIEGPLPRSMGIWLDMKSVVFLEFFSLSDEPAKEEEHNEQRSEGGHVGSGSGDSVRSPAGDSESSEGGRLPSGPA
jgi:hypothetical protein